MDKILPKCLLWLLLISGAHWALAMQEVILDVIQEQDQEAIQESTTESILDVIQEQDQEVIQESTTESIQDVIQEATKKSTQQARQRISEFIEDAIQNRIPESIQQSILDNMTEFSVNDPCSQLVKQWTNVWEVLINCRRPPFPRTKKILRNFLLTDTSDVMKANHNDVAPSQLYPEGVRKEILDRRSDGSKGPNLSAGIFIPLQRYGWGEGIPRAIIETRMVGGSRVVGRKYPYIVSIREKVPGGEIHFCGGTIIHKRWVITAAHCLVGATNFNIVAGSNYLDWRGTSYPVLATVYFNKHKGAINDIALLLTQGNIVFDEQVQPAQLPKFNADPANTVAWIAGWGRTDVASDRISFPIRELPTTIISNSECYKGWQAWKKVNAFAREKNYTVSDRHICTRNPEGEGSCFGDSGGPLMVGNVIEGIIAFGAPCALGYPDVYTRLATYIRWIEKMQKTFSHL